MADRPKVLFMNTISYYFHFPISRLLALIYNELYNATSNRSNLNHLVALSVYIPKDEQVLMYQEVVRNKFEVNK